MKRENEQLKISRLERYFPKSAGWNLYKLPARFLDRRQTAAGSPIRCIDYRFGQTPDGYKPEAVPLGPAWLGAIDGIAAFYSGSADERMGKAVKTVEALGFKKADHGDYLRGDEGCAFRRALFEQQFPELAPLSRAESRILRSKYDVEHILLHPSSNHPDGFVINNEPYTTVLPDDGRHYPVDTWVAQMAGITSRRFLPVIAKCGELLLPEDQRNLYIAS